ncbi:MAG: DUF2934 domain-containing protein [Alphaproteobacteria bacterium]|nr:DUF2934 domain-containing protein [Alphaproteobacteria bacterium]
MSHERHIKPSGDEIRLRSYLIWEREGRREGCSEDNWRRAEAELEAEFDLHCHTASLEGHTTEFVLPLLPISKSPTRTVANRVPDASVRDGAEPVSTTGVA